MMYFVVVLYTGFVAILCVWGLLLHVYYMHGFVVRILSAGQDINEKHKLGWTALMVATANGHLQ